MKSSRAMLLFWLCLFVLLSSIGSSFGAEQSKTTDPSENVQEKLTVMENTLTPRIFNTSSLFNYNASSISNYISNYLQFYYGNSAEWIKTPWFALVSGMIDTVVLVVLVGIFIVVCASVINFIEYGYPMGNQNRDSWDYYDEEEDWEELNRSTRSVMNALDRMWREFNSNHENYLDSH